MAKLEEDFLSTCNTKPLTYLRYTSFLPDHSKHSIIYSQALRYYCICSDTAKRNHHLKTLKSDFINRGYNPLIVDQYMHAATMISRSHLLYGHIQSTTKVPQKNSHLQGTLHKDERLKSIFPDPPLLAFRQPPNLKSLQEVPYCTPPKVEHTPVAIKQCKTCPHILTSDKIPIPDTLQEYSMHGQYNCSSSNVVYLIQCTKCITGGLYI
ncbi:hypothetical protein XELAEV_18004941mg [Xenopus laevis]|uniref:Helix-turn-helix domain-containing protein n=1 Tax=Xenopus laevis TaxID=8355 RepID=A0A974DX54_XENLA|nr:hypothetical protein XELAEV_18004941mg [Xenopus laevis]